MNNQLTKIFDSIGFNVALKNNNFTVGEPVKGYRALNASHIGYYIPYLVRNNDQYEVGVGYVELDGDDIVVQRYQVVRSSQNDQAIKFSAQDKYEFYIFANESNFNTGLNNVVIKNNSFYLEPIMATYLIDSSEQSIDAVLPSYQDSNNLIIEFKLINGNNPLIIRDNSGHILYSLDQSNTYIRIAYKDNTWHELANSSTTNYSTLSSEDNINFSSLADPAGSLYSFQYKDGPSSFAGSNLYWSSGNTQKLLLGADNETSAHSIIPTSGNDPFIINNTRKNNDFIVNGSGNKNLFFAYDGRLGLNIPSGSRPQTIFHVVNTICQEGFRLENRKACNAATITLYHAPSGTAVDNTLVSQINLAGKNSSGNEIPYTKLQSTALNVIAGSTKGEFAVIVATGVGNDGLKTIKTNPDNSTIGYDNNKLSIDRAGVSKLGYNNHFIEAASNGVSIKSSNIVLGSGALGSVTVLPTLYATNIESNNIKLSNIPSNSILTIDSSGNISSTQSLIKFPNVPSGYLLSTAANGSVTGVYKTDSYFLTDKDITWNKYPKRTGTVCLRQVVFTSPVPIEEFQEGDQIAVITPSQTYYRDIVSMDVVNNTIIGLLVNQNLTETVASDVSIYSITRGGYFLMQMYVEPGTIPDATTNIFSIRSFTDTVFNSAQKDINFLVYGIDSIPALSIKANNNRLVIESGIFHPYATQQGREPFAIPVNPIGDGTSNANNTANYKNTASGVFSGMVSTVGSNGLPTDYGTYDQNGNVAEWIQDTANISISTSQYAAGGSWSSTNPLELRSIIPYSYSGTYNNIGFRICGSYGLLDNNYISTSSGLELKFVSVDNPSNIASSIGLYTKSGELFIASGIPNLGVVDYNYRIGQYEITNAQYVKFLNTVASTDSYQLYNTNMNSSDMGGISRSGTAGSYSYYMKPDMSNKPVTFTNYLSAIRFTNWLHNGCPTGLLPQNNTTTEDGAYSILSIGANSYQITKNTYQNYWLPNIHEWYKAAYFEPRGLTATSGTSNILIKRNEPFLAASGEYANLSVSGWLYADKLILGDGSFTSPGGLAPKGTGIKYISMSGNQISLINDTFIFESGSFRLRMGNQNNLTINTGKAPWDGTYGNYFSSSGIELSANNGNISIMSNRNIKIYSPNDIQISGLSADTISVKTLKKLNANGEETPIYSGAVGSLVYKYDDFTPATSDQFIVITDASGNKHLTYPEGNSNCPLYINSSKEVVTYTGITFSATVDISNPVTLPQIQIGENNPFFRGSVLTHAGQGYATWEPAEYLKADGVLWHRYSKRPVLIYENKFVFNEEVTGGNITLETASTEFKDTDTIALVNLETRETYFVKAADGYYVVDNENDIIDPQPPIFSNTEDGLGMTFCPESPWPVISGAPVSGYAYSVNRGGYLSMQIDPIATSGFSCENGVVANGNSPYGFKPSTLNHVSIRPEIHTAFNLLAEDIDFVVYGARRTRYHRYEPELFELDETGIPSGLIPAFKIDAKNYNAVSGDAISGVYFSGYLDLGSTQPTGYKVDELAKICINTKTPYTIASIPSGNDTLNVFSDLTVNGYSYSSGIIAQEIFLRPKPNLDGSGKYVINAPLTINSYGQVISQVPAAAPTIPGSPTALLAQATNASATLSWIAPTNTGGRNIINYQIEYSLNDGNTWTIYSQPASVELYAIVNGLVNNADYIFRVSAINAIGIGSPSSVSNLITPSASRPSAPQNFTATKESLQRTLTWSAPLIVGSSPITNYVLEYSIDEGLTWIVVNGSIAPEIRTYIATGLLNEPTYYFRLKAQNMSGQGAYAKFISIGDDPYEPPAANNDGEDETSIWDFGKVLFTGVCI